MRVKRGFVLRRRHNKILKLAKGFRGTRSKLFKVANQAVMKSLKYAYRDRRNKRRELRRLWIVRINAASRQTVGLSYSRLINGLLKAGVTINRKYLSELASCDLPTFALVAEKAKLALVA
jgi:large subunit ribosomal protein L20